MWRVRRSDGKALGGVEDRARGRSGVSRMRRVLSVGVEETEEMADSRVVFRWFRERDVSV